MESGLAVQASLDMILAVCLRALQVQTYFESIDLDVWDAWTFFKLLAPTRHEHVEHEEGFLFGTYSTFFVKP